MLKKLKGVIIVAILSLASVMMPFNIYADDYSNNTIVGFNVTYIDGGTNIGNSTNNTYGYLYEIEWILDDYYVGQINLNFTVNYGSSQTYTSQARNYYVNGNKFSTTFWVVDTASSGTAQRPSISNVVYRVNSTNLNLMPEGMKQWFYPIESFTFINYMFTKEYPVMDIQEDSYYTYPVFQLNQNDVVYETVIGTSVYQHFVIFIDKYVVASNIGNFLSVSNSNVEIRNFQLLNRYSTGLASPNDYNVFIAFDLVNISSSTQYGVKLIYNNSISCKLIPIYTGYSNNKLISTDFALQYGLTNQLLDDIHTIASGTSQSIQANTDLNTASSEFTSQSDDVIGVEENLTNNFESQIQNIDINTGLSGFGGNFMTSATWVRTQFDRLTQNNPYGSLVAYGLTLGFALLMLGKVLL